MFKTKSFISNLSHHFLQGRRSRALAQALPALNKRFKSFSQTNNYSTLFFTAGKTWPSGPERTAIKYGWISSGLNKQAFIPLLNLHFLQSRRSRALAQALPALNKERNRSSQAGGFTIIEVVLVLAIAGLIFLMVFVALPALQRSQRDTQRKK